jgi:hypothetical protein
MVKRLYAVSVLVVATAVFLIGQIDWTKQIKNVPSYVANALPDPGSNGFVKRTAANTSTVAGGTDVWPGTLPFTSVTGTSGTAWPGTIPFASVTGTTVAWPGSMPYSSLTSVPALLGDPGANGVVKRTALNTTAAATGADLPVMVASGASHSAGAVPDPGAVAGTTRYLREDATWQTVNSGVTAQTNYSGGTRTLNSIYHNTTGKPLFVAVSSQIASGTLSQALTDSSATPSLIVAQTNATSGSAALIQQMFFVVLPGNYYEVNSAAGTTLYNWVEWN